MGFGVNIAAHAALTATHGISGSIASVENILAHAVLTTGVHGVGLLHVAGFVDAGQEVSKVIWKDASETALNDDNRTSSIFFQNTELDLTAFTSANAKFAIVRMDFKADVVGSGDDCYFSIRKNGTTPTHYPRVAMHKTSAIVGFRYYEVAIIGLDEDRKIQYQIDVTTGWTVDSDIKVLGYIE